MICSLRNTNQRLYFFSLEAYCYTKKYYPDFRSYIDWAKDLHYQAVNRQYNQFWLHIWHVHSLTDHSLWCLYTSQVLPATGFTSLFGLCGAGPRKVLPQNSPIWAASLLCWSRQGPQQLQQKMVFRYCQRGVGCSRRGGRCAVLKGKQKRGIRQHQLKLHKKPFGACSTALPQLLPTLLSCSSIFFASHAFLHLGQETIFCMEGG